MIGKFYIDGTDAYAQYGIFVAKDGFNDLVAFAPLKKVESIDWHEENGEEFDLSAPRLDTREVTVKFIFTGGDRIEAFIALLSSKAYHTFEFRSIGRTYTLRMVSNPSILIIRETGLFALRFADDFPLPNYTYAAPQSSLPLHGDKLDGRELTMYGVRVLLGTADELRKIPDTKKNLLRNTSAMNGAVYDGAMVTYKTKDVKIKCLMRANSIAEFWKNHDALLYDLTRPGAHVLHIGKDYNCFYKSCSTVDFFPVGQTWFQFDLTLTVL